MVNTAGEVVPDPRVDWDDLLDIIALAKLRADQAAEVQSELERHRSFG